MSTVEKAPRAGGPALDVDESAENDDLVIDTKEKSEQEAYQRFIAEQSMAALKEEVSAAS